MGLGDGLKKRFGRKRNEYEEIVRDAPKVRPEPISNWEHFKIAITGDKERLTRRIRENQENARIAQKMILEEHIRRHQEEKRREALRRERQEDQRERRQKTAQSRGRGSGQEPGRERGGRPSERRKGPPEGRATPRPGGGLANAPRAKYVPDDRPEPPDPYLAIERLSGRDRPSKDRGNGRGRGR